MTRKPTFSLLRLSRPLWGLLAMCVLVSGVALLPLLHQIEHRSLPSISRYDSHVQAEWNAVMADALQALALSEDSVQPTASQRSQAATQTVCDTSFHAHSHDSDIHDKHGDGSLWHFGLSLFQSLVLPVGPVQIFPTNNRRPLSHRWISSLSEYNPAQPRAPPVS